MSAGFRPGPERYDLVGEKGEMARVEKKRLKRMMGEKKKEAIAGH